MSLVIPTLLCRTFLIFVTFSLMGWELENALSSFLWSDWVRFSILYRRGLRPYLAISLIGVMFAIVVCMASWSDSHVRSFCVRILLDWVRQFHSLFISRWSIFLRRVLVFLWSSAVVSRWLSCLSGADGEYHLDRIAREG